MEGRERRERGFFGKVLVFILTILAIIGLVLLVTAYVIACMIKAPLTALLVFFVAVIMVIVATYFLFIAGSVLVPALVYTHWKERMAVFLKKTLSPQKPSPGGGSARPEKEPVALSQQRTGGSPGRWRNAPDEV